MTKYIFYFINLTFKMKNVDVKVVLLGDSGFRILVRGWEKQSRLQIRDE